MNERTALLLDCLGELREEVLSEAAKEAESKKKRRAGLFIALAASLAVAVLGARLLIPALLGARVGTSEGTDPPRSGPGTYMVYPGPVFPLTLGEPDDDLTAERRVTLDFSPWAEEEYAPDILVTDTAVLTNPTGRDKTVTVLYPFASDLQDLGKRRPTLTADGVALDYALHTWGYVGGYEGAWKGTIGGDENVGSLNMNYPDSWEDFRDALADGSYLTSALADAFPDLSGVPVTVYEIAPGETVPEGDYTLSLALDYAKTTVLNRGAHGWSRSSEKGTMELKFYVNNRDSVAYQNGEDGSGLLIAVGEDLTDLSVSSEGVEVRRYASNLEDALRAYAEEELSWYDGRDGGADFETAFGLYKLWLVTDGPLGESPAQRYDTGNLNCHDMSAFHRVFYAEARVTVPAGGSVAVTAVLRRGAHFSYFPDRRHRDCYEYELTTHLGSNLNWTAQTAALEDRGLIEIVRQNFGFDIAAGKKTVPLTEELYYLEARRVGEQEGT